VKRYEICVSHRRITHGRLDRARRVKPPTPRAPGHGQKARIRGAGHRPLFVAIRSVDDAGNISALKQVKLRK
jgi:hypothetical protein